MKKKINDKELNRKSEMLKQLIDGVVNETIDIPDDALVFFDYNDLLKVFTKKRIELVRLIEEMKPKSLKELATASGRKKQAINRDLRDLEAFDVVKLEKRGKNVIPHVNKKVIVFPISLASSAANGKKKMLSDKISLAEV